MIIEQIETYLRNEADRENKKKRNPFRASSAGRCERQLGYDKLGIHGRALQPRRAMVLRHGTILHKALTDLTVKALGDRFVPERQLAARKALFTMIDGVKISYHPDGALQLDDGRLAVIEYKTMSDFSFERATKGEIDHDYISQAYIYHIGTDFPVVVFLCYRKETSALVEIIFDRDATETVVAQRFGADPYEIAIKEPLKITEIRTPFDDSVAEEVRGKFKRLAQVKKEVDLVPGVRIIEDELIKVQGREKAAAYQKDYGEPSSVAGSWYSFKTGRRIAGFPCSYCSQIERCLGAKLEINNGKPIWIMEGAVRA